MNVKNYKTLTKKKKR